jgi:S-adenosylmethionine:tRNA ribosyltransferase-isomerase
VKLSDFYFDLPEDLIAQHPAAERDRARLMVLDRSSGRREHHRAADLPALLEPGSLLVFNDSRVRRARISGLSRQSGGAVEFLLLEKLRSLEGSPDSLEPFGGAGPSALPGSPESGGTLWRAMVRRVRRRRLGSRYVFAGGSEDLREAEIVGEEGEFRILRFDRPIDDIWLDRCGRIPLPPYIKRSGGDLDGERYQTVYARETGSAAAPTAGLHFTPELLRSLGEAGMETAFITLHVGLGTFLPVRTENIEEHRMHREFYTISGEAAARIEKARAEGRKITAVGTTSLRTLESAWREGSGGAPGALIRGEGSTNIFIYPGYRFRVVDQLFTNFHTPGSTLLMLVSAFAEAFPGAPAESKAGASPGRKLILESYAEAVRGGYRFFSYGDAMLIR